MEPVSLASRIATLAAEQPDTPVAWVVHTDGPDEELTWAQLHRRSSQLRRRDPSFPRLRTQRPRPE